VVSGPTQESIHGRELDGDRIDLENLENETARIRARCALLCGRREVRYELTRDGSAEWRRTAPNGRPRVTTPAEAGRGERKLRRRGTYRTGCPGFARLSSILRRRVVMGRSVARRIQIVRIRSGRLMALRTLEFIMTVTVTMHRAIMRVFAYGCMGLRARARMLGRRRIDLRMQPSGRESKALGRFAWQQRRGQIGPDCERGQKSGTHSQGPSLVCPPSSFHLEATLVDTPGRVLQRTSI
jgi:hypothetical protein